MSASRFGKYLICVIVVTLVLGPMMQSFGVNSVKADDVATPSANQGAIDPFHEEAWMSVLDEYGEELAPSLCEVARSVGLIDEQGDLAEQPIELDGQSYTLDEIREILKDERTDLSRVATVDGLGEADSILPGEARGNRFAGYDDIFGDHRILDGFGRMHFRCRGDARAQTDDFHPEPALNQSP